MGMRWSSAGKPKPVPASMKSKVPTWLDGNVLSSRVRLILGLRLLGLGFKNLIVLSERLFLGSVILFEVSACLGQQYAELSEELPKS